jgi:MoxR-like ATPase
MQENINRALSSINQIVLGKEQQVKLALCCLLSAGWWPSFA